MIIDGGSCFNLALEELVEKLNLKTEGHPNQGRLCTLIIDRGNCFNLASEELVEKHNLKTEGHPNPNQIARVNDTSILVSSRCLGI